jgi:ADP-ribose pyrophosphatase
MTSESIKGLEMTSDLEVAELVDHKVVYQGFHQVGEYHFRHSSYHGGGNVVLDREVFECGRHAAVLPYDPRREEVVLIRQFRAGAYVAGRHAWVWEMVGGMIDKGDDAAAVVAREAREEAGVTVNALIPIFEAMSCPGALSETRSIFLGRADTEGAGGHFGLLSEGENILARPISLVRAIEMVDQGEIYDLTCLAALQWLVRHREQVHKEWLGV